MQLEDRLGDGAPASPPSILKRHPLPARSRLEVVEDTFDADGLTVRRVGLSASAVDGEEAVGSAADADAPPFDRAYYELLERVATLEALAGRPREVVLRGPDGSIEGRAPSSEVFPESDEPSRWRYARSNGVALHVDFEQACRRALWELCERDRILRAWYGEATPEPIALPPRDSPLGRTRSYDWVARAFPECDGSPFSRGIAVAGVFGFPRGPGPMVFGFGARPAATDAAAAAAREAVQLLAFLWGEEAPSNAPRTAPTPLFHLETFQSLAGRDALRRWLDAGHASHRVTTAAARRDARVRFVDLTPTWLRGLSVAKAVSAAACPLAFGPGPFGAHLPAELRIHPIA